MKTIDDLDVPGRRALVRGTALTVVARRPPG
jgi:hypothetical protein